MLKEYIISNAKLSSKGFSSCIKQKVYAMIETIDGNRVFGTNKMLNSNIKVCPRITQKCISGEGYHLCKMVCRQESHAEVDAINNAIKLGLNLKGAKLTLVGHTYCCNNCKLEMSKVGITNIEILK